MKASGTKIIIKPRMSRGMASTSLPRLYVPEPGIIDVGSGSEEDGELREDHYPHQDGVSQDVGEEDDRGEEDAVTESAFGEPMDEDNNGDEAGDEAEGHGVESIPTGRGRGRPRGRGRGLSGGMLTPRARGRPRGSGRGRGRGKGTKGGPLTIRLPKRGDEDGGGDGDAMEVGEDGGAEEGEEREREAPLGGGKPFRRIQGKVYIIENDEFVTDDDPKGDTKVDKHGNLLGGECCSFFLLNSTQ